ncbi:unnamed protein product [Cylicocyclus nassatus]|uniref:SGNH domain-containing protein n=1 Tax=Cylicocyclus nassatus TaxID=53992 RepID=A0AA36MBA2_CYLNA|nr:unnamed protein product [Cylicocyclus nassatus]
MKPIRFDYDQVNVEDAAWNMTLMRQLNIAESPRGTHLWHKECNYSKRFLGKNINPLGFCTMKDGNGTLDMLVAGNSYACNQGDLVYNAFIPYARHFNIFCVPSCEMFLPRCKFIKFNFTQVVEQLKPAVIFLVERSLSLKVPLNVTEPIENDKTFRLYSKTIENLENVTKKIYIVQAFPSCVNSCSNIALQYLKNGKALRTIEDALVVEDAFFARHRLCELNKRCKKCELVDYMPVLVDKKGQYLAYNPDTNLMYLDYEQHFNRFGRQRLQIVFNNLAKDFEATVNKQ